MVDIYEMQEFWSVRLGDDAFYCRGASFLIAFEVGFDASIFQDHARRTSRIFSSVTPASADDFEYELEQGAMLAVFESSAYDGQIDILLGENTRSRCSDEEAALTYIVNEVCLGWGASPLRFMSGD